MLARPWLSWGVVLLGETFYAYSYAARFANCHLVDCEWNSWSKVLLGTVALFLAVAWWASRKPDASALSKFFSSAVFVAIAHMILNGVGIVGPELCPGYDPNCRF